jgi:hypothetical protein
MWTDEKSSRGKLPHTFKLRQAKGLALQFTFSVAPKTHTNVQTDNNYELLPDDQGGHFGWSHTMAPGGVNVSQ